MSKRLEKTLFGLFIVFMSVTSCTRHAKIPYESLLMEASVELENEKYILVVPQNGCSNCVKKSYDFILRNYSNPKIKYVFTHYSSKKAVRVRLRAFGEKDGSRLGFIELELAQRYGISTFYPTLMEIEGNGTAKAGLMNAEDMSDWTLLQEKIDMQ